MKHLFLSEWAGRQGQPRSLVSSSRGSNGMQNSASHNALGTVNYSTPAGLTTSSKASTSSSKSSCGGKCGCGGTCGGSNTPKTTSPMSSFLLTTPVKGGKEKLVVQNRDKINIGPQRPKDALPWDPNDPDHINPEYMGGVLGPLNPDDRSFKVIRPLPPDIETIKTAEDYYQVTALMNTDGTVKIDGPNGPIILRDPSGRILKGHDFGDSGPCAIQSYRMPQNLGLGPAVVYGDPLDPDGSNYDTPESQEFRDAVAEYEERQEAFDRISKLLDTSSSLGQAIWSFMTRLADDPFLDWPTVLQSLSTSFGISLEDLTNKVNAIYPHLIKLCREVVGIPFGKSIVGIWDYLRTYLDCKLRSEKYQLLVERYDRISNLNGWKELPCILDRQWLQREEWGIENCSGFTWVIDNQSLRDARNASQAPALKFDSSCTNEKQKEAIQRAFEHLWEKLKGSRGIENGCLGKILEGLSNDSILRPLLEGLLDPEHYASLTFSCNPKDPQYYKSVAAYNRTKRTISFDFNHNDLQDLHNLPEILLHELMHSLEITESDDDILTSSCLGRSKLKARNRKEQLRLLKFWCCKSNQGKKFPGWIVGELFSINLDSGEVYYTNNPNEVKYGIVKTLRTTNTPYFNWIDGLNFKCDDPDKYYGDCH